ncbi:MAG TPA: glyceraldehyde 3-phosphate dehydrogenase NAD-binding domain-containing protein [Aggregatilinea sp.]|jgi:glyceraldehyde 3-phosphate dehydrogenase|uniref:type I glyceraldehyde-3-phosphate dehydrogenase n=1 Tax=Aggregatilinea sp. TaxID=2806333 RepID=UPI002C0EBA6F|nr:glyceraldehyde 3-phosphate dehydrogenase NAD-binding domain-containing protein [Aggregatilinea sp.]HML22829.1 glyceraldehyde 3-phosphate dehydrogenase NAD-binding domain-containing protein [Aggregatilinea sp.]
MGKIAIHGFGRIGRSAMKAALKRGLFVPASISDIKDLPTLAALFEVDSNYGRWPKPVSAEDSTMIIGDDKIPYFETSQSLPDWGALGVELVIDCTGRATRRAGAQAHLDRGAKRVLVSAASKSREDADAFLLPGINLDQYDPDKHFIVSMASCTTNALAPVVKVLLENVGLKSGLFTTVHAYTNTQSLTDQPMGDRRDSWAAAENIIPSSSGAAKALKFIWPDLNMTGKAYRVPVRTGSIVEATVVTDRATSAEELNDMFRKAATSAPLQGVMSVLEGEWASSRIVGDEHSSIIDLPLTQVMGGTLVTVAAWYDNEMGYSTRLADTAAFLVK